MALATFLLTTLRGKNDIFITNIEKIISPVRVESDQETMK